MSDRAETVQPDPIHDLRISVLYDNNPYQDGLETAWGFACLIEGTEKTILFDTGGKGPVLLANMQTLGISPDIVDVIVLSHEHWDHSGGLHDFLGQHQAVTLYFPHSFSASFRKEVARYHIKTVEVDNATKICDNVYSSGDLEGKIREQALLLQTANGLIVITGCAHPGIVKIVRKAKDLLNTEVLFVMGGFHLKDDEHSTIAGIVADFKQLGVRYAAPCHCSGDTARAIFQEVYQDHFAAIGVGAVLTLENLP